ncbi:family 78 glycoside hydrolase catalytic domain [Muricomes intestini]|jgi:alpha-L-rhamnosidase|uniref:family 78 glycoside hydrolase catalytic domain n=1 Tax=Muricomes intestini TaxID=1796634 RepID=UPI000E9EB3A3|nr:hypothetical protein [Lachnospiraceae bacterium]
MKPYAIRIEHGRTKTENVCITEGKQPLFSWAVATQDGEMQTAYRVVIRLDEKEIWDSGWVSSPEQSCCYTGTQLTCGEIYTVTVSLRDTNGRESQSVQQRFCSGAINQWDAEWLCEQERKEDAVISFFKNFACEKEVASACIFVCGLGYHKVYLNGMDVFTEPMNPACCEFDKRCYYSVIPGIEKNLQKGQNRVGIRVAGGWRNPDNACYQLTGRIPEFTGKTQMSALLRIRFSDGEVRWLSTYRSWQYFYGGVVSSNIFMGERYEASHEIEDWCRAQTEISVAVPAALAPAPCEKMTPQTLENICEQEIYTPRVINHVAEGVWGVDFGQNIAGICRIRIPRDIPAGQVIEIRHMEFLDEDGRLFLQQLRNAASIDTYVAAGGGRDPEYWQPEFTYHGFRYAEVKGYPEALLKEDITAVSLYTDVAANSNFTCGNTLVNQIYKNAIQTEKANIHSLLTDCPQRDERMGWMNDATVRFEAIPYNFDVGLLFPKIVRDCMDVQGSEGEITCTAPFAFGARPADPVCSSYLIAGWEAYLHTGNIDILREAYPGFSAWNEFLARQTKGNIVDYSYYGDWAAPAYACQSEEFAVSAVTPGEFMSTGYFYYNACLLAKMASVIGLDKEAELQRAKAKEIQTAFLEKWWDENSGRVSTGSQGCQSFALWLDILPESGVQKAADYLHFDLVEKNYMFTTGNLCTRYMMEVLTRFGYLEDAWKLAIREVYPSIGFMIQNEATTVWERFELKQNPTMNSHNHPMYGAVVYWYYGYLAGIKPLDAGWKRFSIHPYLPDGLLSASAVVVTPYGDVSVRWIRRYGEIHIYAEVPCGTEAEVKLPWGGKELAAPGFHHWKKERIEEN